MRGPGLVDRMEDYFRRQIAWYEELLSGREPLAESVGRELSAAELDALTAREAAWAKQSGALEREFLVLRREWEAADVSEAERAAVRPLARRAEELARRLIAVHDDAVARIRTRLEALREARDAVGRGRDMLRKYAQRQVDQAGFIDRQA